MSQVGHDYLAAARRLHSFLLEFHLNHQGILLGPDPGVRLNARLGRFVKSYLSVVPWRDDLVYLQAQGYWILDNWLLYDRDEDPRYRDLALRASDAVLAMQREEGHWDYPNPEWQNRVSTVEGCFASLGLLETYARSGEMAYLTGALRWYHFMQESVGFRKQAAPGMLAVNYFAHSNTHGGGVPNNSTLALWTYARLAEATSDDSYLAECGPMLDWLIHVQRPSGELPYSVASPRFEGKTHFLCYQYNAFEFTDLAHYLRLTGDERAGALLAPLARFLASGLEDGVARHDCNHRRPEVAYYTLAVAQALSQATDLELTEQRAAVEAAYHYALGLQRPDGGFPFHSRRNYQLLADRRSYPRYLSMILHHLLLEAARLGADSP